MSKITPENKNTPDSMLSSALPLISTSSLTLRPRGPGVGVAGVLHDSPNAKTLSAFAMRTTAGPPAAILSSGKPKAWGTQFEDRASTTVLEAR